METNNITFLNVPSQTTVSFFASHKEQVESAAAFLYRLLLLKNSSCDANRQEEQSAGQRLSRDLKHDIFPHQIIRCKVSSLRLILVMVYSYSSKRCEG